MKHDNVCRICGRPITYGTNGCMLLGDICLDCHGPVRYPAPRTAEPYENATLDDLNALEDRCLDMADID